MAPSDAPTPNLAEIDDASQWDEIADWYVDTHGEHPANYVAVEQAALRPDDIVLDIGCGGGTAARAATEHLTAGRVFAIDPSSGMIRRAVRETIGHPRRHLITYGTGDAAEIPMEDGYVSVALAVNSLHHWPDPDGGLEEAKRVLRPGGRMVIAEEWVDGQRFGQGEGPLRDPANVEAMLRDAGFTDIAQSRHTRDGTEIVVIQGKLPG